MQRLPSLLTLALALSLAILAARFALGLTTPDRPRLAPVSAHHTEPHNPMKPREYSKSAHRIAPLPADEIKSLAERLTPEERRILLDHGTEPPFCGTLLDNKLNGTYLCRLCALPLFASNAKFDSGTGWPSFFRPVDNDHIRNIEDRSHGMARIEIRCARCDGHLGHVFPDGPKPTGLRYCLNSASLEFFEQNQPLPERARPVPTETAYFAGGCFWGVEDRFEQLPGVIDAVSGYQGGKVKNPTYKQVCSGDTGHAESVRVVYDPARISYRQLLERFFEFHNPTQLNRQGPDIGTQYRSAIFPATDEHKALAEAFIAEQNREGRWAGRVVTKIEPFAPFYVAEEYHQDYNARHGRSCPIP